MARCQAVDGVYYILSLYVPPEERGKGLAMRQVYLAAKAALSKGVCLMKLDDVSDLYRCPSNIYLRSGFLYDKPDGPEMTGRTATVLRSVRGLLAQTPRC